MFKQTSKDLIMGGYYLGDLSSQLSCNVNNIHLVSIWDTPGQIRDFIWPNYTFVLKSFEVILDYVIVKKLSDYSNK